MKKLLVILLFPLMLMHVVCYMFINSELRERVDEDLRRWNLVMHLGFTNKYFQLCYLHLYYPEYRFLYYQRIVKVKYILNFILRRHKFLYIETKTIGGGLIILHGFL